MSVSSRLERLEPRERRLLSALAVVFFLFVVLLIPAAILALLSSQRSQSEELRSAIAAIQDGRARVAKRDAEREKILQRYASPAPPLAAFLEKEAKSSDLEIPESQDRPPIPHGKQYQERSTKIMLRRVGMYNLAKLMERIAQSNHPVYISRLNIRKRGTGNDTYDVQMIVSAMDRTVKDTGKDADQGKASASRSAAQKSDQSTEGEP